MPTEPVVPDQKGNGHFQPSLSLSRFKGLKSIFNKFTPKHRISNLRQSIETLVGNEVDDNFCNNNPTCHELTTHEHLLISNILKLRGKTADDVMLPRADIFAIPDDIHFDEALEIMRHQNHSRMPVYHEQLDNIVGMIHVKDLIAYMDRSDQFDIKEILRQPLFVAPQIPVLDLLLQMRSQRIHLGLIIDEYGSVDGLVTIEDLVETIVGDIADEYDDPEVPMLLQHDDHSYEVDARMTLEDLEAEVGKFLTDEERQSDIDTVGGLVFLLAEHIPTKGEVFTHSSGHVFRVLEADARHIRRIRLHLAQSYIKKEPMIESTFNA